MFYVISEKEVAEGVVERKVIATGATQKQAMELADEVGVEDGAEVHLTRGIATFDATVQRKVTLRPRPTEEKPPRKKKGEPTPTPTPATPAVSIKPVATPVGQAVSA